MALSDGSASLLFLPSNQLNGRGYLPVAIGTFFSMLRVWTWKLKDKSGHSRALTSAWCRPSSSSVIALAIVTCRVGSEPKCPPLPNDDHCEEPSSFTIAGLDVGTEVQRLHGCELRCALHQIILHARYHSLYRTFSSFLFHSLASR